MSSTSCMRHRAGDPRLAGVQDDGCLSVAWGAEGAPQICGLLLSLEPPGPGLLHRCCSCPDAETAAGGRWISVCGGITRHLGERVSPAGGSFVLVPEEVLSAQAHITGGVGS